ncbi:hypothetical protein [Amycolatopsis sp. CA-230715]|uniref:hypothetical protein n=1 Tax=Amycolatopsis sp. CA-230715 TaxID=2745196 RepID=UPI001C00B3FB|nr:hypothetical protein [Amycolatopsis sp. CA-230715]QWF78722.1 hypothetical protein HUW46_02120 [Amycolatopsis sp. CA-230715]
MATNTTTRKATAAKPAAPKAPAPKAADAPTPETPAAETKAADAPAAKTPTPAVETKEAKAKRGKGDLFTQLALNAKQAEAMPAPTRGKGKPNPLADLVQRSYDENKPFELEGVAPEDADAVKAAVRRAAARNDLGVNLTQQAQDDGTVTVFLQGKNKEIRDN